MKIAVLGAMGFLGANLSQHLVAQGHSVTGFVLDLPQKKLDGLEYESVTNLLDPSYSAGAGFDVSINVAARRSTKMSSVSSEDVFKYTYLIPKEFFLKTTSTNSLAINASTYIQNFHGILGQTVDSYGAAKQKLSEFLELTSQADYFRVLDLFLFTVYGRGDRQNHLVPTLLSGARTGAFIDLSPGHQLMNLIHIQDVIENFARALNFNSLERYVKHNLWSNQYLSVRNLVSIIENVTGHQVNCNWGARSYVGHEMLEVWPIPMELVPGFAARVSLQDGIMDLWTSSP
jgi:nucleoside-diphosphate-sugar epimerase